MDRHHWFKRFSTHFSTMSNSTLSWNIFLVFTSNTFFTISSFSLPTLYHLHKRIYLNWYCNNGVNKLTLEAMPDLVLKSALPLVSWDVSRLKSSEALRKNYLFTTCWLKYFCSFLLKIFFGVLRVALVDFVFKKIASFTYFSASGLPCADTSAWFLFSCSETSSC